jgi:hypothetical protein
MGFDFIVYSMQNKTKNMNIYSTIPLNLKKKKKDFLHFYNII